MSSGVPESLQPPGEESGRPPASEGAAQSSARPPSLRSELQNWTVLDADPSAQESTEEQAAIEGEAHRLDGPPPGPPDDDDPAAAQDLIDAILIAGLPERRITVRPGGSATLVVSLLNNGTQPAIFDVYLEGWVHESWLPDGVRHLPVHPGERLPATITIAPPRHVTSVAGEFPIFVVVRSPQHLRRETRLAATLVIQPFTDFGIGRLSPAGAEFSFLRRSAAFLLPISNLGNHPVRLQAYGQSAGLPCAFDFQRGDSGWQPGPVLVDLGAGESIDLLVRARLRAAPVFAARPIALPLKVSLGVAGELRPPRTAPADTTYRSPIKLWHMVTAMAASVMLLAITAMLALAARVLLQPGVPPAAAQTAAAPPVVIVLNQAPPQPAPAEAAPPVSPSGAALVQAGQVTPPGEAGARPQGGPRVAAPGEQPLTYAQMFQEIALQYDLDWRLLAAQAYVESSFDTLALGSDGDMGLMQVLPSTWREWAPVVGASDPFDAYSNTLVAAAYLDHVRTLMGQRGLPQAQWMLVGYNWGPDRLASFVDAGGVWEQLPAERAQYASDILNIARTIP